MKKIIATCLALFLMVVVFAVPVSVARIEREFTNEIDITDDTILSDYELRSLAMYHTSDASVSAYTYLTRLNTSRSITGRVYTYGAVYYTDGTRTTADLESESKYISSNYDGILNLLDFDANTSRVITNIYTEHYFYSNNSLIHLEEVNLINGETLFPNA